MAASKKTKTKTTEESNPPEEQSFSVRMPKTMHRTLRVLCAAEGLVMNNIVNEAVALWLSKHKGHEKYEVMAKQGEAA